MGNASKIVSQNRAVGFICFAGPALVTLVAIGVAAGLPAMAAHFAAGADGTLFAQMILTWPAIMMIFGAPLAGLVAERAGRRVCLLASLLLFVVGGTAGLYVSSYSTLVISRLLLGLGAGGIMTSFLALIGQYYEGHARERMLGFSSAAGSIVAVLALMVGGELVDRFGWRAPFAFYLLGLVVIPVAWYGVSSTPAQVRESQHRYEYKLLSLWPFYLLLFLFTIGIYTPGIQMPFLLEAKGETSAAVYGSVVAVSSFTAALGSLCYGYMRRFLSERGMYVLIASGFGVGIIAVALAETTITIAACSILMGIVMGTAEPTTASAILKRAPEVAHDRAMGLLVSALFMGQFANPWVFNLVRRPFGIEQAFLTVGAGFVVLALLLLIGWILPSNKPASERASVGAAPR